MTDAQRFYWDVLYPGKLSGEVDDPTHVRHIRELHAIGWLDAIFQPLKGKETRGLERALVKALLKTAA